MRLTLAKEERITHQKQIGLLFSKESIRIFRHPLLIYWNQCTDSNPIKVKVLFSVPKKKLRKAHDRNRVKRLLREIYRKNKPLLLSGMTETPFTYCMAIQYIGTELPQYDILEKTLLDLLMRFTHETGKVD